MQEALERHLIAIEMYKEEYFSERHSHDAYGNLIGKEEEGVPLDYRPTYYVRNVLVKMRELGKLPVLPALGASDPPERVHFSVIREAFDSIEDDAIEQVVTEISKLKQVFKGTLESIARKHQSMPTEFDYLPRVSHVLEKKIIRRLMASEPKFRIFKHINILSFFYDAGREHLQDYGLAFKDDAEKSLYSELADIMQRNISLTRLGGVLNRDFEVTLNIDPRFGEQPRHAFANPNQLVQNVAVNNDIPNDGGGANGNDNENSNENRNNNNLTEAESLRALMGNDANVGAGNQNDTRTSIGTIFSRVPVDRDCFLDGEIWPPPTKYIDVRKATEHYARQVRHARDVVKEALRRHQPGEPLLHIIRFNMMPSSKRNVLKTPLLLRGVCEAALLCVFFISFTFYVTFFVRGFGALDVESRGPGAAYASDRKLTLGRQVVEATGYQPLASEVTWEKGSSTPFDWDDPPPSLNGLEVVHIPHPRFSSEYDHIFSVECKDGSWGRCSRGVHDNWIEKSRENELVHDLLRESARMNEYSSKSPWAYVSDPVQPRRVNAVSREWELGRRDQYKSSTFPHEDTIKLMSKFLSKRYGEMFRGLRPLLWRFDSTMPPSSLAREKSMEFEEQTLPVEIFENKYEIYYILKDFYNDKKTYRLSTESLDSFVVAKEAEVEGAFPNLVDGFKIWAVYLGLAAPSDFESKSWWTRTRHLKDALKKAVKKDKTKLKGKYKRRYQSHARYLKQRGARDRDSERYRSLLNSHEEVSVEHLKEVLDDVKELKERCTKHLALFKKHIYLDMDLEASAIEGYSDWGDLAEETFNSYWAAEDGIEYLDLAWRRFKRNKMDVLTRAVYIEPTDSYGRSSRRLDGVLDWLEVQHSKIVNFVINAFGFGPQVNDPCQVMSDFDSLKSWPGWDEELGGLAAVGEDGSNLVHTVLYLSDAGQDHVGGTSMFIDIEIGLGVTRTFLVDASVGRLLVNTGGKENRRCRMPVEMGIKFGLQVWWLIDSEKNDTRDEAHTTCKSSSAASGEECRDTEGGTISMV